MAVGVSDIAQVTGAGDLIFENNIIVSWLLSIYSWFPVLGFCNTFCKRQEVQCLLYADYFFGS